MIFTCPDCGSHKVENIYEDVLMYTRLNPIDGSIVEDEYQGGTYLRSECVSCGHEVSDNRYHLLEIGLLELGDFESYAEGSDTTDSN